MPPHSKRYSNPEPAEEIKDEVDLIVNSAAAAANESVEEKILTPTEVSKRVYIIERSTGCLRVEVPDDIEITFGTVSVKRDNGNRGSYDHDYGRDLRFYRTKGGKKILLGTLTGVSDFYPVGLFKISKWNPTIERKTNYREDNSGSESSSKTTIKGDWEPYSYLAATGDNDIPF